MSDDQSPIPRALDSAAENTRAGAHADGFSRTTLPRLGVITGDRSCHACGFNLRGQPIVREQHYDMVMVRCPECAAVAPLLDYPRYSHWARRLWAFVALLWMSLVVSAIGAFGVLTSAVAVALSTQTIEPLAVRIAEDHNKYQLEAIEAAERAGTVPMNQRLQWSFNNIATADTWIDSAWWNAPGRAAEYQGQVDAADYFNPKKLPAALLAALVLIPSAGVLAVVMPHWKRFRLLIIPLVSIAVGSIMAYLYWKSAPTVFAPWVTARSAVQEASGVGVVAVHLAATLPLLVAGVYLGRPMARTVVLFILPPRQRVFFAFLWDADGKALPKGGGRA